MAAPVERIVGGREERSSNNVRGIFGDEAEQARFLRRLGRALRRTPESRSSPAQFMASALRVDTQRDSFPYSIEKLEPLAETSATAMRLLTSAVCSMRGRMVLMDEPNNVVAAVRAYAQVYRMDSMVVRWDLPTLSAATQAFEDLANDTTNQDKTVRSDAFFVLANLAFLQHRVPNGLQFLHMAQRLNPRDADYHAIEGCILAMQLQKQKALDAFNRAKTLGCQDIEHTLFHRAILFPAREPKEGRDLLEQFVDKAEKDARKLPEACFRLVMLYGIQGPGYLGAARRYYERGLQADADRLPIFRDEAALQREQAKVLVKRYHTCGNPDCPVEASNRCKRCEGIYYCCRDCQVNHWKVHKENCKKA